VGIILFRLFKSLYFLLLDLLDRGWRRSGSFLYKPEMERTCCPSYTIRLKASDYVPSKEQLRVSRRMQRYDSLIWFSWEFEPHFFKIENVKIGKCYFC